MKKQIKCGKCKGLFDLSKVHINSRYTRKNGSKAATYYCSDCQSERARKYRTTQRGKDVWRELYRRQIIKHRVKVNARQSWNQYMKYHDIKKPLICSICKLCKKLDAHHDDYKKPHEVKWMCRKCHLNYHKNKKS